MGAFIDVLRSSRRLIDDDGRNVAQGQPGELLIRGPTSARGTTTTTPQTGPPKNPSGKITRKEVRERRGGEGCKVVGGYAHVSPTSVSYRSGDQNHKASLEKLGLRFGQSDCEAYWQTLTIPLQGVYLQPCLWTMRSSNNLAALYIYEEKWALVSLVVR